MIMDKDEIIKELAEENAKLKGELQTTKEQTPGFHSTGIFERSLKGGDEAKRHLW